MYPSKVKPLTVQHERLLQSLIDNVPEPDTDNQDELNQRSSISELLEKAASLLSALARNQSDTAASSLAQSPPQDSNLDLTNPRSPDTSAQLASCSPDKDTNLEYISSSREQTSLDASVTEDNIEPNQSFSKREEAVLNGLEDITDTRLREQLLEALRSDDIEDIMFCDNVSEPSKRVKAPATKNDRVSVRRSVRRSARFIKDDSAQAGSVFSVEEVPMLPSKMSRLTPQPERDPLRDLPNPSQNLPEPVLKAPSVKKRRYQAEIENSFEDKENSKAGNKKPKGQRKGQRRGIRLKELSPVGPNVFEAAESGEAPVDSYQDEASFKRRSSKDIALPDCVRRSLTGEFVPQRLSLLGDSGSSGDPNDPGSGTFEAQTQNVSARNPDAPAADTLSTETPDKPKAKHFSTKSKTPDTPEVQYLSTFPVTLGAKYCSTETPNNSGAKNCSRESSNTSKARNVLTKNPGTPGAKSSSGETLDTSNARNFSTETPDNPQAKNFLKEIPNILGTKDCSTKTRLTHRSENFSKETPPDKPGSKSFSKEISICSGAKNCLTETPDTTGARNSESAAGPRGYPSPVVNEPSASRKVSLFDDSDEEELISGIFGKKNLSVRKAANRKDAKILLNMAVFDADNA